MKNETIEKIKSVAEISAALGFIGFPVFAVGALVGSCTQRKCDIAEISKKQSIKSTMEQTRQTDIIGGEIAPDSKKVFDKGQHYISVRIAPNFERTFDGEIVSYAINKTPEGYDIYQITPYTDSKLSTNGYDIWFVNNQPVEVEATYNTSLQQFGYYSFGKPVNKDKTLTK